MVMPCRLPMFRLPTARFAGRLGAVLLAWRLTVGFALAAAGLPASVPPPAVELDATAVSAFAAAAIPAAMRDGKIPGAVFVVVQGNRVVCEQAYGVADLKTGRPVSTNQTLFRVASISKIFTAASALELVQAHLLDLHRNVNAYLTRFHIASAFGAPVTLANLLTHSGGFDDCEFGYAARSPAARLALGDYLKAYQPARVRPPGLFSVYDNYGYALAGYLVQKASGIPFADFEQERIFGPLDMAHSSFSPDARLRRELATGYWLDDGTPRSCSRNYINITPAAGLCTTAADMAGFMAALLTDRQPDGARLFPTNVIRGLETQQFASTPDVSGWCYGFNCVSLAGRRALRQNGQWSGFNSVLLLFPRQHCALFLAYNLCDYLRLEQAISRQFAEKFIPPDPPMAAPAGLADSPAADSFAPLLGTYLSERAAHDAPELVFPAEIEVSPAPGGNLDIGGQPYREIAPLVFEHVEPNHAAAAESGRRVAFRVGRDGAVRDLITQSATYHRASWWAGARGQNFLMSALTVVFVSALVLWPAMVLMRFVFADASRKPAVSSGRRRPHFSLLARGTAFAACVLALWFEFSFALAEGRLGPFADFYGLPASVRQLLWILPLLLGLTALLAVCSAVVWRRRVWHPAHRWHYLLLTAALGLFVYAFWQRHLLFVG